MAVDLRWHDACSASRAFSQQEKAGGWPESMTAVQLAALQRPYKLGDAAGMRHSRSLLSALDSACDEGDLPHDAISSIKRSPRVDHIPSRYENTRLWPDAYVLDGFALAYSTGGEEYTVITRLVHPKDFAAWLHAQGESPSVHISAWFEARGVAGPLAVNARVSTTAPVADTWDGARLLARRNELKRAGVRARTQELVRESGLKERDIRRLIQAADLEANPAPVNNVFGLAGGRKHAGRSPV